MKKRKKKAEATCMSNLHPCRLCMVSSIRTTITTIYYCYLPSVTLLLLLLLLLLRIQRRFVHAKIMPIDTICLDRAWRKSATSFCFSAGSFLEIIERCSCTSSRPRERFSLVSTMYCLGEKSMIVPFCLGRHNAARANKKA